MQTENPFKGASPYEDGDQFYGRENEIKELSSLIKNEVLTLLFSRSGTGKSSLIKAGLFPFLNKELEFFPVYIHLNDAVVKDVSGASLCAFVIKRCEEEIKKQFSNNSNFKIQLPGNIKSDSLFQFIHQLEIIETDNSESTGFVIKPVLVFDQFEEIFTNPFDKDQLQILLKEIRCLVENEVPEYLRDLINTSEDTEHQKLRNALKNKQKNFRFLFSFREEYLPQFESLKKEIPSIRFTSSRYRLEPFTIETAEDIIFKTAPKIPLEVAHDVAENIAANVEGFDEKRVDPFLLSLICQIIYPELLSDIELTGAVSHEKIKKLVENAIDSYVNKVYGGINTGTKKFVEDRLITSDGKKNSVNYNEVTGDGVLQSEIEKMVTMPDYRMLSVGQFLDSKHITILHDRLLPPLIQKKLLRKDAEEKEALVAKQQELVKSNRKKQRRILAFFIAGVIGLIIWFKKVDTLQDEADLQKKNAEIQSLKSLKLKQQADSLKEYAEDLKKDADTQKAKAEKAQADAEIAQEAGAKAQAKAKEMSDLALSQTKIAYEERRNANLAKEEKNAYKDLLLTSQVEIDLEKKNITAESLGNAELFNRVSADLLRFKKTESEYEYGDLLTNITTAITQKDLVLAEENSFKSFLTAKEIWEANKDAPYLDSVLLYNFFNKTIFYKQIVSLNKNNSFLPNYENPNFAFSSSNNKINTLYFAFNNNKDIYSGEFDADADSLKISPVAFSVTDEVNSLNSLAYVDNKIAGVLKDSVFTYTVGEQSSKGQGNRNDINNYSRGVLSPNGKYLVTYSSGDSAVLWKLDNFRRVDKNKRILNIKVSEIKSIIFSHNSQNVLFMGTNEELSVFSTDFSRSEKSAEQSQGRISPLFSYQTSVNAVNFTPDGKQVMILSGNTFFLKTLNQELPIPKFELSDAEITGSVKSVSLSVDWKKLLIETDKEIIVVKRFNGDSVISISNQDLSKFIYKKFQGYNFTKSASFLDANSIIIIDAEGKVYLCKIYNEFETMDEAFETIKSPPMSSLSVFDQFKLNPTASLLNQILSSGDEDLIYEASRIVHNKYDYAISPDKNSMLLARILYSKEIKSPHTDTALIADKLIELYKKLITNEDSLHNKAPYTLEIIRLAENIKDFNVRDLSSQYGNLSYYSIFKRDFTNVLNYAKRGIELDSTNSFIYTNLALGYLFNKNFPEAEKVYAHLKDSTYSGSSRRFVDSFEADFKELERYGIINEKDRLIYDEVKRIKQKILKLQD